MGLKKDPFFFLHMALAEYGRRLSEESPIKNILEAEDAIAEALNDLTSPELTPSLGAQLDRLISISATALQAANELVLPGVSEKELEALMADYGIRRSSGRFGPMMDEYRQELTKNYGLNS